MIKHIKILEKSSFYETPSYPDKINPKFINVIIDVITDLPAVDLASVIIHIEKKLERKRNKKNDPRTFDLDIIDYKRKIMSFKFSNLELTLPHKEMSNRNFVLYPLKEISQNWSHPVTKKNIDVLIKDLKSYYAVVLLILFKNFKHTFALPNQKINFCWT